MSPGVGESLGARHPEYAQALSQLGDVYAVMQQPDRSAALERQAQEILTNVIDQGDARVAAELSRALQTR